MISIKCNPKSKTKSQDLDLLCLNYENKQEVRLNL